MQVIQQFKKHTISNKNHKSPINRGVKNHTFKFNKHTFNSYIKNMHRITSIGVGSSFLLVLLIL
ncbi:hypothetical protein IJG04_00505, partial [Candidatus Saccharibacteria bacterium]|nr:hypothetical protein [Candidatus Saccharibacteria bacterium]